MREPRPFGFADLILLVLVVAAAAGARSFYLWDAAESGNVPGPVHVQEDRSAELADQVTGLREQQVFLARAPLSEHRESTAFTAPGYAYLLYLVDMVSADRDRLVRWIQVGLGALTAGLYFLFSRRAFHGSGVAALAGFLCALNPFGIAATAEIADGVLASFLLALALALGARGSQTGGALTSLAFGLSLAGLALVRAALLPFGFLAVLWFLTRCRRVPRGWLCAALAFLGFANGLVPWTIRNYQVFGEILPIVDSTYYHLWVGNNSSPLCTGGPRDESIEPLAGPEGEEGRAAKKELAALSEDQRYRRLAQPVWEEVRSHPAATVRRRVWSGLCFFFGDEWLNTTAKGGDAYGGLGWMDDVLPILFPATLILLIFVGAVGWRWSYAWSRESMPAGLAVVWAFLPYMLTHGEHLYGPRLPIDGVLLCYAAFALVGLVPRIGHDLRHPAHAGDGSDERLRP